MWRSYFFVFLFEFVLFQGIGWTLLSTFSAIVFTYHFFNFLFRSSDLIAFRELALLLFSLNYILAPTLMYNGLNDFQFYKMVISEQEYLTLAIPAVLLFQLGMYSRPTNVFRIDLNLLKSSANLNEQVLKQWVIAGLLLRVFSSILPSELAFFLYLLSSVRYIGAFGLLSVNFKKYGIYTLVVFLFEFASAIREGLFHDLVLWLVFFALLITYLYKPSPKIKVLSVLTGILFLFILQITKNDYRTKTWTGGEEAGVEAFSSSIENSTSNSGELFSKEAVASSLTRVNQGWIFSSTVDNMQKTLDFQSFALIGKYIEAALLPRFLAPDKLNAGSRDIFNRFSGKFIDVGTSMALGILADGFVSFGDIGVYVFAFLLGLLFCTIFRVVEKWTKVSPFFFFFLFPILHYAVRPDCETQTVLGHVVKGLFIYYLLVLYYEGYFRTKASRIKFKLVS